MGDSRSIVIQKTNAEGYYKNKYLSHDHKPQNKIERERIEKMGGAVIKDEDGGPWRAWKKGEKYPGIATSRSIGDMVASTIGIISEPGIII